MSIFQELRDTFRYRQAEMRRIRQWERQVPRVGELAPDFTLSDLTGQGAVTLSHFRGQKPVALVFGSFT